MTARKKIVSSICIITLILAITAGIALSVGAQPSSGNYFGESVNLVSTSVNVSANTSTEGVGANKPAEAPADAVAIGNAGDLKKFLSNTSPFNVSYGYLTADMTLNWDRVGSNVAFGSGRVINGNGWTVTLEGSNGKADGFKDSMAALNGWDYGLFVAYNEGTIKNIKFKYNQNLTIENNAITWDTPAIGSYDSSSSLDVLPNYAGFVCGTNAASGIITNCDLDISGSMTYNYTNGRLKTETLTLTDLSEPANNGFAINFGGITGRNAGSIKNITANYNNGFTGNYTVTARNHVKVALTWWPNRANATVRWGGIAGTMYSNSSEIRNVIITGRGANVTMNTEYMQNTSSTSDRARRFNLAAAIVASNSEYSRAEGGIGQKVNTQATVDNIIMDLQVNYNNLGMSGAAQSGNPELNPENTASNNAVVYCGKATNVTVLTVSDRHVTQDDIIQHVDYQTDHCNCGASGNSGENHEMGNANVVYTDNYSDATVGMDAAGNQYITGTLKQETASKTILGDFNFTKYAKRGTDGTNEKIASGEADTATYADVVSNGLINLYSDEVVRASNTYEISVRPYQDTSNKFWELYVNAYQYANISKADSWNDRYVYTGEDFLPRQLKFTSIVDSNVTGAVNTSGMYAVSTDGSENQISVAKLPKVYSFALQERVLGLSYVDSVNKVIAWAEDNNGATGTASQGYSFEIVNAEMQMIGLDYNILKDYWLNEVVTFDFEVIGGIEGAADGYNYTVNGSAYQRSGLSVTYDSSTTGRVYSVYLTSGGVQVTNPIVYTIKMDLENPTLSYKIEHKEGFWAHNTAYITAKDNYSGIANIYAKSYESEEAYLNGAEPEYTYDVIAMCNNAGDSKCYINAKGEYVWWFEDSGYVVIDAEDASERSTTVYLDVKIDTVTPTVNVEAYYVKDGNNDYLSGYLVDTAVHFKATAQYGEAGGRIEYSFTNNDDDWNVYTDELIVKQTTSIYFRAVSNSRDHEPTDITDNYVTQYNLYSYWDKNKSGDDVIAFSVRITLQEVIMTFDDVIIDGLDKVFDGTTKFMGSIRATDAFLAKLKAGTTVTFDVQYEQATVGEGIKISIKADCDDDTHRLVSDIASTQGNITKRGITVNVDSQRKEYGYAIPTLTFNVENMINGFDESGKIMLYVIKPEGVDDKLLPNTESESVPGYTITVDMDNSIMDNYYIAAVNENYLNVDITKIDRLYYEQGAFTGLDTKNIANRNLEIGFLRVNGEYEKLEVVFVTQVDERDDITGELVTKDVTYTDMSNAPSGFYTVKISLPKYNAAGERLDDKYYLDKDIVEFRIKVIRASRFPMTPEEAAQNNSKDDSSNTNQTTPTVSNNGTQLNGNVTSSIENSIENSAGKTKDYIAMISIFGAVAVMIALAAVVGRVVIKKRAKR